jgi:hypothetical protein
MTITLDPKGTGVAITLTVTNVGALVAELAPWGPTVMAPGGVEIIPQPPHRDHPGHISNAKSPACYAPTQQFVFWPYFDFTDPRWTLGSRYLLLRQDSTKGPTKIGLAHRQGWVAYLNQSNLFVLRTSYVEEGVYPDMGTSYQTFSNEDMLEMEPVAPMAKLRPGDSAELRVNWRLFGNVPDVMTEDDVDRHILPLIQR